MKLTTTQWGLIGFSLAYVLGFGGYYIAVRNYEFLWYVAVLVLSLVLVAGTLKKTHFDTLTLGGLSLWGLLHMMGGGIQVKGEVLYALRLLPIIDRGGEFYILKFDQVVHAFGFMVATLAMYHLLWPYLGARVNWKMIYAFIFAAGMGLGALNEVVEFVAVLLIPDTGVGGYYNTALDLVFNLLGALIALGFIHFYYKPRTRLYGTPSTTGV